MTAVFKGTFAGPSPSMGFKPGQNYVVVVKGNRITTPSGLICPYGSIEAFLMNWENVTQIKDGLEIKEIITDQLKPDDND
jgi:hypothetical protein